MTLMLDNLTYHPDGEWLDVVATQVTEASRRIRRVATTGDTRDRAEIRGAATRLRRAADAIDRWLETHP